MIDIGKVEAKLGQRLDVAVAAVQMWATDEQGAGGGDRVLWELTGALPWTLRLLPPTETHSWWCSGSA